MLEPTIHTAEKEMDRPFSQSATAAIILHRPRSLAGRLKQLLGFVGPAFVVSVAYIDPGNFATNIAGGSIFNYNLVWVILWSNLMAIFLQTMSAKLGIATGKNLPELCGTAFSRPVNWVLWAGAELAAMATNIAEFIGATLGFYLLFHIPMIYAGLMTAVITFMIVWLEKYGQRVVEIVITVLVAVICGAYAIELSWPSPTGGRWLCTRWSHLCPTARRC